MSPSVDALSQSITRTTDAANSAADGQTWPWLFARCWMLANRFDHHGRNPADLEAALDDFARLPADAPGRAHLAAVLVNAQLRAGAARTSEQIERVSALADVADTDPAPFAEWCLNRSAVRALWLMDALRQGHADIDARAALVEIDRLSEVVGTTQPYATMVESARILALHVRSRDANDLADMDKVQEHADRFSEGLDTGSPLQLRAQIVATMQAGMAAVGRGDLAAAAAVVERVLALRHNMPANDPLGAQIDEMASTFHALRGLLDGSGMGMAPDVPVDAVSASLIELRKRAARTDLGPTERALNLAELGVVETGLEGTHLDDAVEHLRAAVDIAPTHDARRAFYLMSFGTALARRYEIRRRRRDLVESIDVLEQGRKLAGGPAHPYWAMVCQVLGHAYRLSGRRPLGCETGRDGLRGHAWSVLLQSQTEAATAAARHAATDAVDVARWCLDDNDPAGAAAALDAGRGLILQAAVQFSDVSDRLTALDEPGLAQRWQQAITEGRSIDGVPIDLRREVVDRLGQSRAPRGAGEPGPVDLAPEPPELRAALTKLGADALVYLVPGEQGVGAAVVVPARDEPSWLPLPQLTAGSSAALERYLADAFTRDARSAGPGRDLAAAEDEPTTWRDSLGELCDWAWTVAIGPLLDRHLAQRHDLTGDLPLRLVLVPMGALGRVPWHAARYNDGSRQRYAVERAVFSYAVSARMLCDSAWAKGVALTPSGLVIGDPDTHRRAPDLPAARTEAIAIRDQFYQGARYVGRTADGTPAVDGPGDREDVERWLADDGADAGTMLHAACHGVVRTGTGTADTSYLLLADGKHLAAEDLIRTLTTRRRRGLALAVLAACSSGVPGRGYDEAFSLATAFLASGTQSVISAQWRVPDSATSVLMFMFHHYQRQMPAADALRAAQLWMIEPDRQPPGTMPDELRRQLSAGDPADIAAWAGFVHAGR